ncbi:hypothetical protein Bca52824_069923 [Brassica carinata]|uniref:Uncharacterized protein n=1 Tax=Brassica carinata TaxID=52824 RepID=A0A8X7U2L5_BRACI|nr:hypothetical protein Bca52824_069923 [Brassica carinata]
MRFDTVDFVDQITVGITRRRSEMDPATEIRETKRKKEYINMLANVADSETGIPTRCPCGGRIIHEADGLHYRQPWVIGVEEHIERLTRRVEEVEVLIKFVPEVNYKIQRLEVADLEKLCFD